jgi:hypothetical protein
VSSLVIEVGAGLSTGEVETIDGKAGGLALVIGTAIGAREPGGPRVQTVRDLTAAPPSSSRTEVSTR